MSKKSLFKIKEHKIYRETNIKKINNYFAQNALRTSWGNLRANGAKLESLKLFFEAMKFSKYILLNYRSFF